MLTSDKKFEHFEQELSKTESSGINLSFQQICRRIHAAPADIDAVLLHELGINGTELVDMY